MHERMDNTVANTMQMPLRMHIRIYVKQYVYIVVHDMCKLCKLSNEASQSNRVRKKGNISVLSRGQKCEGTRCRLIGPSKWL